MNKPKPGRPPINGQTRTERFTVRCTPSQKAQLQAAWQGIQQKEQTK